MAQAPPVPTLAGQPWQLLRASRLSVAGKALANLAEREAAQLGAAGMVMGYGLSAREHGLEWFLDGLTFDPYVPGKAGRKPFAHNWNLVWSVPEAWDGGASLSFHVVFSGATTRPDIDGQAGLRAELRVLCGARMAVVRAFDAIDRGEPGADAQLTALAQACPDTAHTKTAGMLLVSAPERDMAAEHRLERSLSIANGRLTVFDDLPEGQVRRILLTLRGVASRHGNAPGDALLAGTTAYYIYGPVSVKP